MKLEFQNQSRKPIPRKLLNSVIRLLWRELSRSGVSLPKNKTITLVFLNPPAARRLNSKFRKKNYATDVLSFGGDGQEIWAELVLCPQVLERQAREQGHSFRRELVYMVIHGVLHCLGYDHERGGAEARHMFHLQDQIFRKVISNCKL